MSVSENLDLFAVASPVRTSALPDAEQESTESDQDSGQKCSDSSENSSQDGSWLRTYLHSALAGLTKVLADLESQGYTCWPFVVGAWAVGASHQRDRAFIVATNYPSERVERLRPERFQVTHSLAQPVLPLRSSDGQWEVEPDLRRAANGLPRKLDAARLKAIGNAVNPQTIEIIGRAILEADAITAQELG